MHARTGRRPRSGRRAAPTAVPPPASSTCRTSSNGKAHRPERDTRRRGERLHARQAIKVSANPLLKGSLGAHSGLIRSSFGTHSGLIRGSSPPRSHARASAARAGRWPPRATEASRRRSTGGSGTSNVVKTAGSRPTPARAERGPVGPGAVVSTRMHGSSSSGAINVPIGPREDPSSGAINVPFGPRVDPKGRRAGTA